MQAFSSERFVRLLTRAAEVAVVGVIAMRWMDAILGGFYRVELPQRLIDAGDNFGFLALLLLLACDLVLLLTRQPRAVCIAVRTLVYAAMFVVAPYRLGHSPARIPVSSNQAMQPTASPRTASLLMINTRSFQSSLAVISGG